MICTYAHTYAKEKNIPFFIRLFTDTGNYLNLEDHLYWAGGSINYLASLGIVNGVGDYKFNPSGNVTRAEFAKMIVKLQGYDNPTVDSNFPDVSNDAWYYSYVSIAYQNGIMTGNGDGTFCPDVNISREDIAVIFSRIFGLKSENTEGSLSKFADVSEISPYAQESVVACVEAGLIMGSPGENSTIVFKPKSNAIRAEAAVFIHRAYLKKNKV